MSVFSVKVYHQAQVMPETYIPHGPQDSLSWRMGDTVSEPKFEQVLEAVGKQDAKLRFIQQHPEFSETRGSYQFDVRFIY